jgi:hypothetical protein
MPIFTELFADAPYLAQALSLLQLALTVWMMVDAYHRRVESFWYCIIILFQPIGAWAYFFIFKFRAPRLAPIRLARPEERRMSLHQLRYHVERAPTVANRLALAERLMENGEHLVAIPLLEAALALEPDYLAVLHALAKCQLATNHVEQARVSLEKLLQRDPRWRHYLAWRTLIEVHQARGSPADALEALRELAKRLPTIENKCRLAEHLLINSGRFEAMQILDDALQEHRFSPWGARWHNRRWARLARRLRLHPENGDRMNGVAQAPPDKAAAQPVTGQSRE